MGQPRRQVISQYALMLQHPNPETVTVRQLHTHIDKMPESGWFDKEEVRNQFNYELDGARPPH